VPATALWRVNAKATVVKTSSLSNSVSWGIPACRQVEKPPAERVWKAARNFRREIPS